MIRSSASIVRVSNDTPSSLDLTSWRFDCTTIGSSDIIMTSNPQRVAHDQRTSTSSVQPMTLDVVEKRFDLRKIRFDFRKTRSDLREKRLDAQEIVAHVHEMHAEVTVIEAAFLSIRLDVSALSTDRLEEQADALTMRCTASSTR